MNPVERFTVNIAAAFGKNLPRETFDIYIEKLSHWSLTEAQWSRACSSIIGAEETFPKLSQIRPYLLAQLVPGSKPQGRDKAFLTFYMPDNRWYAMIVDDPSNPPAAPRGAYGLHLVLPEYMQAHEDRFEAPAPAARSESDGWQPVQKLIPEFIPDQSADMEVPF